MYSTVEPVSVNVATARYCPVLLKLVLYGLLKDRFVVEYTHSLFAAGISTRVQMLPTFFSRYVVTLVLFSPLFPVKVIETVAFPELLMVRLTIACLALIYCGEFPPGCAANADCASAKMVARTRMQLRIFFIVVFLFSFLFGCLLTAFTY